MGFDEGCGKPRCTKQLVAVICGVVGETHAIADDDLMGTSDVKRSKLKVTGGVWACFTDWVAQLNDVTEGRKILLLKVLLVPSLQR